LFTIHIGEGSHAIKTIMGNGKEEKRRDLEERKRKA